MATLKQIKANRANAQKSTGPQTPEAKAKVRFNALQHGLRAESAVIPGEDQSKFNSYRDSLINFWHAQDEYERDLVEQIATNQWKLARIDRYEATLFTADMTEDKRTLSIQRVTLTLARLERTIAVTILQLQRYQEHIRQAGKDEKDDQKPFISGFTWDVDGEKTYYVLPQVRGLDGKYREVPRQFLADRFHPRDPGFKPNIIGKAEFEDE